MQKSKKHIVVTFEVSFSTNPQTLTQIITIVKLTKCWKNIVSHVTTKLP